MTAAELQLAEDTETERVIRWRVEELERAGYDSRMALLLGLRTDVDLHLATDLLGRGCSPRTAVRILV